MTVAEIVIFKPYAGVESRELLEKARNIDDALRAMPGFVGREILQTDDGKWIDLVRWRSLQEAREAAEKVMTIPECLAFFDLIDKETMMFMHATPAE